jgi:hypothetical protein
MARLRTLDAEGREPYLRTIRDLLNATYGEMGGKAEIKDGKIIFEQAGTPSETSEGFYTRVEIRVPKVQVRD